MYFTSSHKDMLRHKLDIIFFIFILINYYQKLININFSTNLKSKIEKNILKIVLKIKSLN